MRRGTCPCPAPENPQRVNFFAERAIGGERKGGRLETTTVEGASENSPDGARPGGKCRAVLRTAPLGEAARGGGDSYGGKVSSLTVAAGKPLAARAIEEGTALRPSFSRSFFPPLYILRIPGANCDHPAGEPARKKE